jgi:hypothetical protein
VRSAALAPPSLLLAALALAGCATTAETSARLEHAAKAHERAAGPSAHGLSIARQSSAVKVLRTTALHSREGSAAVVTLRNTSSHTLRQVPVEIRVLDARGAPLYANTVGGLAASLTSVAVLPAHAELSWIDDQIQAAGTPASVHARIGQSPVVKAPLPQLSISTSAGAQTSGEGAVEGVVVNHSGVAQRELVVYAVARRGARIVGAGRAVLAEASAHASTPFQLFLIGQASGARLRLSVPPTTLG